MCGRACCHGKETEKYLLTAFHYKTRSCLLVGWLVFNENNTGRYKVKIESLLPNPGSFPPGVCIYTHVCVRACVCVLLSP